MRSFFYTAEQETYDNNIRKWRKSHAELTTIITAAAITSSIHRDTLNTQYKYGKCSYNHKKGNCPTYSKDCYNCGKKGHFTGLCRKLRRQPPRKNVTLYTTEHTPMAERYNSCWGNRSGSMTDTCQGSRGHSSKRSQSRDHYRSPSRVMKLKSLLQCTLPSG